MSRSWCPSVALSLVLLAGCGGAPSPAPNAPVVAKKSAKSPPKPTTPRGRLIAALHSVEPEGPVLGALDARTHAELNALVQQLSPRQRSDITRSSSPAALARPLLFLALGGDSPRAYYALAVLHRGADELVSMCCREGGKDFDDLVQVASGVSRRAAAHWLRDRAVDAASKRALTPELCDQIDRAADTLHRLDVRLRAREMAVKLAPSAERQLAVARAAAWQFDVAAAGAALARARSLGIDSDSAQAVERLIGEAALAEHAKGTKLDVDKSVQVARALLDLQRPHQAMTLLAPYRAEAGSQLGLASALARAANSGMCAGPPDVAGPDVSPEFASVLLGVAYLRQHNKALATAAQLLDSAWKSGKGRDDRGIQTWLGMKYVVLWPYQMFLHEASSGAPQAQQYYKSHMQSFQRAVREASSASHTFDGLVLYLAAATAPIQHKPGQGVVYLEAARQQELQRRALELGKRSPGQRFTQAAVLVVAALLSQDQDIGPLLGLLPDPVDPAYRHARAVLEAWNAVARGADAAGKGRRLLAQLIPRTRPHSLERAKTVLLMAELEVALTHAPRAYRILAQVAGQLTGNQEPLSLRLRAGIDRAGALSRAGRDEKAETLLSKLLAPNAPGAKDHHLGLLARGYLLVLRARTAKGNERRQYIAQLSHLFDKDAAPAWMRLWRDMWQRELTYQTKKKRCGAFKACRARAAKERKVPAAKIDAMLGPEAARILRSGTLSIGTLHMSVTFSMCAGVEPEVPIELQLLAVGLPGGP